MVINVTLLIVVLILAGKIISAYFNLLTAIREIRQDNVLNPHEGSPLNFLIVIPVLREQNVITNCLEHFKALTRDNMVLTICIAGTTREAAENSIFKHDKLTRDIVSDWIKSYSESPQDGLQFLYTEATDDNGDRASQLNFAVNQACEQSKPDIIGVYDADSLPDSQTLIEVMSLYSKNPNRSYQQPVHFIKAANRMAKTGKNPLLIANALCQTTWTMIHELPRWSNYKAFAPRFSDRRYHRNIYLIGHGEFVPYAVYKDFKFPENEVTDGIQIGYRLSMSGLNIAPLHTFCEDDVPQSFGQIVSQHKRWFGGCNRLYGAYKWSQNYNGSKAFWQMLDGYWSQASWAYAAIVSFVGLGLSYWSYIKGGIILPAAELILLLVYCYLIPFAAHNRLPVPIKVRLIDWLCLPVAIAIKGIGPNLYFLHRFFSLMSGKNVKYGKVERISSERS